MNRRFLAAPAAVLLFASYSLLVSQTALAQAAPQENGPAMAQDGPGGPGGPPDDGHHFPMHRDHGDRDHGDRFRGDHDRGGRGHDGGPGMHGDHPEFGLLPPGTWWRIPELAARIGLTKDQTAHIDSIFLDARSQLIQAHATLEEEELHLEPLLRANPIDQSATLAQISKIADTRADLEKANAKMLLDIRAVLSADQWTKLRMGPDHGPDQFGRGPGRGFGGMRGQQEGQPGAMHGQQPAPPPAQ